MALLVLVSVLWAFSFGLIKRFLGDVDSTLVAALRLCLSLVVFLPFLRWRGLSAATAGRLAGIGALQFGVMYLSYIESFRYLRAYEAALFTITTPVLVVLFADALDRRWRPWALAAALVAVAGTAVVVVRSGDLRVTLAGLALVQLSNAAFAAGQIFYRRLRISHPQLRDREIFAVLYAGAAAAAGLALLWRSPALSLTTPQWLTLLYLGAGASGLGFFLWNVGATRVAPATLAVMNNAKVPLGVAVSILVFGETADPAVLLASFALLGSALWLAARAERAV